MACMCVIHCFFLNLLVDAVGSKQFLKMPCHGVSVFVDNFDFFGVLILVCD